MLKDQGLFIDEAWPWLFNGGSGLTLAEVTRRARALASDQNVRQAWGLFGDPTTRLKR
jgi:hypothetical protein